MYVKPQVCSPFGHYHERLTENQHARLFQESMLSLNTIKGPGTEQDTSGETVFVKLPPH